MGEQREKTDKKSGMSLLEEKRSPVFPILSWIHDVLLFAGLYIFAAGIIGMDGQEAFQFTLGAAVLIVPVMASWAAIRKIKPLWLYLAAGVAATGIMGAVTGNIMTGVCTALVFLIRGYVRIRKGQLKRELQDMPGEMAAKLDMEAWEIPTLLDEPHPWQWILFGMIYMSGIFIKIKYVWHWEFYLFVAEVFVCFIYCYLDRMWGFMSMNSKIANLPVKTMKRVGKILLGTAAAVLVLFVLPSVLYQKDILADWVNDYEAVQPETEYIPPEEEEMPDGKSMEEILKERLKPAEPPAWLMALGKVFSAVILAAFAAGLAVMIYKACQNAIRSFNQEDEDEVIFLKKNDMDEVSGVRKRKKTKEYGYLSVNMRIRRRYKKTIQQAAKQAPQGWESPAELEENAGLKPDENTETLHWCYEKARYSKTGCTKEEARDIL